MHSRTARRQTCSRPFGTSAISGRTKIRRASAISALFLVALGLIYGMLGTLNLADMAMVLPGLPDGDHAVVHTAFALLIAVFALKAAPLPRSLWLPHA